MTRLGDRREGADDRREGDPTTLLGGAFRFANNQTPLALIALAMVGFLAWLYVTQLSVIAKDLHDHVTSTSWYQRQSCLSLAVLAGTAPALCDPAGDTRDPRDRR